ncbi:hypothetical protein [Caulobacter sp. LARHSG274]
MRHRGPWLALGVGAALLGACSTAPPPRPIPHAPPPARAETATPAPAGMVWNYLPDPGGEVRLNYGLPNSDQVGIMFSCRRPARAVGFVTDLDKGEPGSGTVRFRSDQAQGRYAARLERSELTGGWEAHGEIALADPVLARFETSGRISQVEDRAYAQDARSAAERKNIKRFFGFCRG